MINIKLNFDYKKITVRFILYQKKISVLSELSFNFKKFSVLKENKT